MQVHGLWAALAAQPLLLLAFVRKGSVTIGCWTITITRHRSKK
jgi:hypothetical protein